MIGQGRTAEVYAWDSGKILKLYFDWFPMNWIKYEADIGRAIYNAGVPSPELFDMVDEDGRKGLIYQRIDGVSLLKLIETKPWQIPGYARQMAQLHFKIHQFSTDKLPSHKDRMTHAIMKETPILGKEAEKIITYLNGLPSGNSVCHGDFHPDNILVSAKGWVAIDWMNAYEGNPLSDVARTCLMIHSPFIPPGTPRILMDIIKCMIYSAYIKEYLKLANVKWEDIETWMLPVAAARICEKVPGEEKWLLEMIDNKLKQHRL